jgi:hypothetical protein
MLACRSLTATRLRGVAVVCSLLLGAGGVVAAESNGLSFNGLSFNGLSFNGLSLNEGPIQGEGGAIPPQSKKAEAAQVWDSVRKLSKESLGPKK